MSTQPTEQWQVNSVNPKFILNETNFWLYQLYLKQNAATSPISSKGAGLPLQDLTAIIIKIAGLVDYYF